MYSLPKIAIKYLQYYLTASNGKGHGVHSPFVFDFIKNVLNDDRHFYAYDNVERVRESLLRNDTVLQLKDFGAGSVVTKSKERKVSSIAKSALKPKKFGQLLMRIVNYYQLQTSVELGTCFGVTSAYIASGNVKGKLCTMEGAEQVAAIAKKYFEKLQLYNIEIVEGNFDDTLPKVLKQIRNIDLAFIDGNHRKEPTLAYFNQLLQKKNEYSIFIFDDIHWSRGMEEAWRQIQQHPEVTLTIDLFFIGLVFFRKEQKVAQHFEIRF